MVPSLRLCPAPPSSPDFPVFTAAPEMIAALPLYVAVRGRVGADNPLASSSSADDTGVIMEVRGLPTSWLNLRRVSPPARAWPPKHAPRLSLACATACVPRDPEITRHRRCLASPHCTRRASRSSTS